MCRRRSWPTRNSSHSQGESQRSPGHRASSVAVSRGLDLKHQRLSAWPAALKIGLRHRVLVQKLMHGWWACVHGCFLEEACMNVLDSVWLMDDELEAERMQKRARIDSTQGAICERRPPLAEALLSNAGPRQAFLLSSGLGVDPTVLNVILGGCLPVGQPYAPPPRAIRSR